MANCVTTHSALLGDQMPIRSPGSQAERQQPGGERVDLGFQLAIGPADVLVAHDQRVAGRASVPPRWSKCAPMVSPISGVVETPWT